jgi:hypothetical protein
MRIFPLLLVASLLAGCESVERMAVLTDPCRQHLSLSNRYAIAKCLPADLQLFDRIDYVFSARRPIYLEERLAEVGANVGKDGKLRDGQGKEMYFYHVPPGEGPKGTYIEDSIEEQQRKFIKHQHEEKLFRELQEKYRVITIYPGRNDGRIYCPC